MSITIKIQYLLFTSIRFKADPAGTHYWHSHSGVQRVDGLHGPLIVREPNDPNAALYDYDLLKHIISVQDWEHKLETSIYSAGHHSDGGAARPTILVNGNITHMFFSENHNLSNF